VLRAVWLFLPYDIVLRIITALLLSAGDEAFQFLEPGSKNHSINFSIGWSIPPLHAIDNLLNADLNFITFRELYPNATI
jgi:hypothetical protein